MGNKDTSGVLIRVGRTIKALREHSEMTHAELARKLHLNKDAVVRIERGQYNMRLSTLFKIAHIFGRRLKISFVKMKGGV